jgi:hypothetical protein
MQTVQYNLFVKEYPAYVQQDTDTATPRQPIPIYYIHDGDTPFCTNTSCFCRRAKRAGAMLYQEIAAGKLELAQFTVHLHAPLIEGIPEECQLLGHTWELTESPDIKECAICHFRGYCPGCTPQAPAGATAFYCTSHTGR